MPVNLLGEGFKSGGAAVGDGAEVDGNDVGADMGGAPGVLGDVGSDAVYRCEVENAGQRQRRRGPARINGDEECLFRSPIER